MTDRVDYLTVALKQNTREDDIQALVEAISLFYNVLSVTPHIVSGTDWTAEQRAKASLRDAILPLLLS